MKKFHYSVIALLLFATSIIKAQQVTIVGIQLTPFNITPETMLSATIQNSGNSNVGVQIKTQLFNSDNQLLLTVKSAPFAVTPGINTSFTSVRKAQGVEYTNTGASNYLKTTRGLPSGNFKVCVSLEATHGSEDKDEYCDEIESDFNQYLYLVSPSDKDSMEIKNPMLVWTHSEPFNVLARGESFRMIVTEMKGNQTPEEAINMNTPIMTKNNLLTHNLQYPYEARGLEEGKHYAWQVSKVSNGTVIAQTEVWEFSIMKKRPVEANYTSLKTVLDGGYYTAKNNKVFFKFEEQTIAGKLNCKIYDSGRNIVEAKAKNESMKNSNEFNFRDNGYNQFEIDLDDLNISKGFHTLEILNEKGELYLLKFYYE